MNETLHLERIEKRLEETVCRVSLIEERQSKIVRLQTFAPEPFEMLKEICVLIEQDEEEVYASFVDANVNASGCNQAEAIENLKENVLSRFDYLEQQNPEVLAKPLKKQREVLREFVRRKS